MHGSVLTDEWLWCAAGECGVGCRQLRVRVRVLQQRPLQLARLVQQPPVVARLQATIRSSLAYAQICIELEKAFVSIS